MSVFRDTLLFLDGVGVYDVVLPLLLIFSIVFAILEKTRVFGLEKVGDKEVTRKNINAMVAFCTAFFVVASSQLVATINKLIADVSLIIVTFVMFMLMIGVFSSDKALALEGQWKKSFMVVALIALILIFFNALGWLLPAWAYLSMNWNSTFVATAALLGGMALFVYAVTKPSGSSSGEKKAD